MQSPDQAFGIYTDETSVTPDLFTLSDSYGQLHGALMSELTHVIDCVRRSQPSEILRPEDALNVIRVAAAIVRSCEINQPVSINLVTP